MLTVWRIPPHIRHGFWPDRKQNQPPIVYTRWQAAVAKAKRRVMSRTAIYLEPLALTHKTALSNYGILLALSDELPASNWPRDSEDDKLACDEQK